MSTTFYLKQGMTQPSLLYRIDPASISKSLTGASVLFDMWRRGGASKIDAGAGAVHSVPNLDLRYDWQTGDTEESGVFLAEFTVIFADTTRAKFPSPGYLTIIIPRSL